MLATVGGKGRAGKILTALGLARALDGLMTVADSDTSMPDLHLLLGAGHEPALGAVADGTDTSAVASP